MKSFFTCCLLAIFAAVSAIAGAQAQDAESRYVILYKKNGIPGNAARNVAAAGGQIELTLPQVGIAIASSSNPDFAAGLAKARNIQSVGLEAIHSLPNTTEAAAPEDHGDAADVYLHAGMLWGIERVHAPEAWAAGHTGSHDTVLAVIDTGVAWNHPDLGPNVVDAKCFTAAPDCNPYPSLHWHGTHVAGTAAAIMGGAGAVGVAPDLGIASYNVFEEIPGCGVCAYTSSRWMAMIDAASNGYQVITMSLGGYGRYGFGRSDGLATYVAAEQRVASLVTRMGSNIVASSGNGGADLNGVWIHVPGDVPGIVNVGATGIQPEPRYTEDSTDHVAYYSNTGAAVTVAAPGGDCGELSGCSGSVPGYWNYYILSTYVYADPVCAETASCPLGFVWSIGTSMATPHASAVLALIRDANPNFSPAQATARLKATSENIGSRLLFGHGMVDAAAATSK